MGREVDLSKEIIMIKYLNIIIFGLIIFMGCSNSAKTNVPSWFLNSPIDAEKIYGAGVSKNEGSALLF